MNQQDQQFSTEQRLPSQASSAEKSLTEAGVAIIGYGTAGVNALIALRSAGYQGKITVFSNTRTLPYSPILTSYYAGGEKMYEECFPWDAEELDSLGAEVLSEHPVTKLDVEAHTISTAQDTFAYMKCIIATGATPTSWGFTDVGDYEPLVLRTMDDAECLKIALAQPECKRVLVSGASMVALKTLESCLNHDLETTLVGMNPHVLDFNALHEAAAHFERGLQDKGVQLRLGQTMQAVRIVEDKTHSRSHRLEVTFSNGEVDAFDEIAVAHGVKCNLDFVSEGALERDRALIVDDFMRTSDPDVYAAGDVAQATELISGEKRVVGVWKNAAVQGACAGKTIAAELAGVDISIDARYKGSIPTNTIAVNGTLFISAGTMEVIPGRHVKVEENDEMMVVYLFQDETDGTQRLVGFNIVCDTDEAGSRAYDIGAILSLRIEKALFPSSI